MKLSASVYAAEQLMIMEDLEPLLPYLDSLHFDIMDGHFAPAFGLNPLLFNSLKQASTLPIDVHIMVSNPDIWGPHFASLGARWVAFHLEACQDPVALIEEIRQCGSQAYLALKPDTSIDELTPWLDKIDGVLLLAAPAGGGEFCPQVLERTHQLPAHLPVVVDGGMKPEHFAALRGAENDAVVVGRGLFEGCDKAANAKALSALL